MDVLIERMHSIPDFIQLSDKIVSALKSAPVYHLHTDQPAAY